MNEAQGTVIELDGDYAWVRMNEAGCGRCHEAGGCGGQRLEKMFCDAPAMYRVHNPVRAQPGERVTVVLHAGALGRGALRAYGLPLLAVLIGAFGGSALAGETGAMLGAALGLLAGWLSLRHFQPTETNDSGTALQPYIRR